MKTTRFLLPTCFLFCASIYASCALATTFHIISVADTNDGTIGKGAGENVKKIQDYFSTVSKTLETSIVQYSVTGTEFSCQKILEVLSISAVKSEDIVVFYYSGHGYRTEAATTKFPSFYCDTPIAGKKSFGLNDVAAELEKTKPRLILAIADTCNVLVGQTPPSIAAAKLTADERRAQLSKLFLKNQGTLLMSSSKPGQFSWYAPNGGLFTSQLMQALEQATLPSKSGVWNDVLAFASKEIVIQSGDAKSRVIQSPQYDSKKLSVQSSQVVTNNSGIATSAANIK